MSVDVILCNFTRLGDLLQTQPLLDDLRSAGYSAGLVCLENFAAATPLLRNVDEVWPLPGAGLLAATQRDWPQAVEGLLGYVGDIVDRHRPAHVLNLTPTLPARLLARLLARQKARLHGFALDEFGFGLNQGVWASFLSVAARKRINAPFNVADMLRSLALPLTRKFSGSHLLAAPPDSALAWADKFLAKALPGPRGYVAFQPGASEDRRRWPLENFRQLGSRLWHEEGLAPLLLGSAQEKSLGREYAKGADHPFVNAIGQTDLQQLAALLRKSRLLVTNDTGTMHLAAGQNLPSLSFFLATAQPWDTGPLLDGCCCLEPALHCHPCAFGQACANNESCRQSISAGTAASLARGWLANGKWETGLSPQVAEEARVWLTEHDADGFARLRCLSGHDSGERGNWLAWTRAFWRQFLDKDSVVPMPYAGLKRPEFAPAAAEALLQAGEVMASIADCGKIAGRNPMAGKLFLRNCERLQNVLEKEPHLAALAAFWREFRQNQEGNLAALLPALEDMTRKLRQFGAALSA